MKGEGQKKKLGDSAKNEEKKTERAWPTKYQDTKHVSKMVE